LWIHPASPLSGGTPLSLLHPNTWEQMDEVVAASGGKPEVVAKKLLEQLRKTMITSPMPADPTSTLTFMLMTFTLLPQHPLAFAILADNGTWVVARMLSFASERLTDPRDEYFTCVRTGINFLRHALVQYDSPRMVSQAVDAGLLHAICVLSPFLQATTIEQSFRDMVRAILREILPKSMVYRSVVKLVKRELDEIDPELVDKTILRSYLCEEWMSLVLLMSLRSTLAKFPKEVKGKGTIVCGGISVRRLSFPSRV
jgi:hypothetical protein